jgi:metal-dependent amidase/aminoacylase/carboxypeptidase family protein
MEDDFMSQLRRGFRVRPLRFMPTTLVASKGRGRPVIGILAEYDALPDCGPAPDGMRGA